MIDTGGIRRSRMPMIDVRLTDAPAATALTHSPTGIKYRNMNSTTTVPVMKKIGVRASII